MSITAPTSVKDLSLDLANYRTVRQPNEINAIQAMITISPDYFWGLMDSLLSEVGYLPTETILVLDEGTTPPKLTVREGNRRIAILKLIHRIIPAGTIAIPGYLEKRIEALIPSWKAANEKVPCVIYPQSEAGIVDRIVTLAHGKGDKASRDKWNAVARARHSRDVQKINQPGLDILEAYVASGTNLTSDQAERWSGDYPLTVLDEAMKKLAPRLGFSNAPDLAKNYPAIPYRNEFDNILLSIGQEIIKFGTIRTTDIATKYGIPLGTPGGSGGAGGGSGGPGGSPGGGTGGTGGSGGTGGTAKKPKAVAINDPRAVKQALKKFVPRGPNREKLVSLIDEACYLDLDTNPIAFCFLLRSMFEVSAKAYCEDHKASGGPTAVKADGNDRRLGEVLKDIYAHMIALPGGKKDQAKERQLFGPLTDISTPASILSVTSMNQLVHNPHFAIRAGDISGMFFNIFPLLEAMNN